MAAERNPYYSTNGAAAYDVYSVENTIRQPVREPERHELPQERELPQKRQRVRARTAVAPFTILGAAISACMMILVIFGYVQLFEATSRVSKLESQLQSLQEEQLLLQSKYEGKIDLAGIEEQAETLGLKNPRRSRSSMSISPVPIRRRSTKRRRAAFSAKSSARSSRVFLT